MLESCILPKLGDAVGQMAINPAAQDTQPVSWLLAWHGNDPNPAAAAAAAAAADDDGNSDVDDCKTADAL